MLAWLLQKSDSQTSFACLMTTIGLMIVARLPLISSKTSRLVTVSVLGSLTYIVLDATIEIRATILALLGRDPTLTSRTDIWRVLWQFQGDPIIGVGFMSFWTGQRLKDIWEACACQINQAHNGYIEQFLNLGYVGVGLMVGIMVNGLNNVRARLNHDRAGSIIRFCFIVVTALYNYTEASFYGISNIYVLALIGCLDTEGISERKAVEKAAQTAIAPAPAAAGLVTQPTIFVSPYRAGRTGVTRQTAAR